MAYPQRMQISINNAVYNKKMHAENVNDIIFTGKTASRKKRLFEIRQIFTQLRSFHHPVTEVNTVGNIHAVVRHKSQIEMDLVSHPVSRKIEKG